eukprot:7387998-Prymnesium_polylepis.1
MEYGCDVADGFSTHGGRKFRRAFERFQTLFECTTNLSSVSRKAICDTSIEARPTTKDIAAKKVRFLCGEPRQRGVAGEVERPLPELLEGHRPAAVGVDALPELRRVLARDARSVRATEKLSSCDGAPGSTGIVRSRQKCFTEA